MPEPLVICSETCGKPGTSIPVTNTIDFKFSKEKLQFPAAKTNYYDERRPKA
jgi:hypothetical protein